jgi:O-antigen ligase
MVKTNKITDSFLLSDVSKAGKVYAWCLFAFAIVSNFSISLTQTSLSIALICAIFLYKEKKLELHDVELIRPFLFLAVAGILSIFKADLKIKALEEIPKYMIILVFFISYLPPMTATFKKFLLTTLIVTASLTATLALIDVFAGNMLNDRAKGFFSTSITFGECQAMVGVLIASWLLAGFKSKKQGILLFIALILVTASMISTMARGAWLGFAAGAFVLTFRFPRKMLPILVGLALITGPVIWFTPALRSRLESFSIRKNLEAMKQPMDGDFDSAAMASNYLRLNIWQRGFAMTANRAVFGVGVKNVKKNFYDLASDYEKQNDFLIFGHQHSNFMQIYAMKGLLGLCAFFIFLVIFLKFLFSAPLKTTDEWSSKIRMGAAAIFVCFIVTGFTEHSWGDEEVIMMAFFLSGLLMNSHEEKNKDLTLAS